MFIVNTLFDVPNPVENNTSEETGMYAYPHQPRPVAGAFKRLFRTARQSP